jgi:hypothetical protein
MPLRHPNHLGFVTVVAAALLLFAAAPVSVASAAPVATFSRQEVDFSRVPSDADSPVQAVFVTNTGDAPLNISGTSITGNDPSSFRVAGTCMAPLILPPNSRCRLELTMHGNGNGTRQAIFALISDSLPQPATIDLRGLLDFFFQKWRLSRSVDWFDFPATPIGASTTVATINVQNNEDFLVFGITGISLVGGDSEDFTLASTCPASGSLPNGPGCDFVVGFQPTASGPRSTLLRLSLTAGGISGDFSFSLTGIGAAEGPPLTVTVVEYHNSAFDHYFMTPLAAEIALLDAKAPPFQDWSRTGLMFNAYANAGAPGGSVAICRLFNSNFGTKSSHFYAPHGFGCEDTLAIFPDWTLEDDKLFNALLPDASGNCAPGSIPIYRLYNGGMGGAPNHRFVASLAERQKMLDLSWVPEGAGIGVAMCVPP